MEIDNDGAYFIFDPTCEFLFIILFVFTTFACLNS